MKYLCEILLKIVQSFFHCVPDQCARDLVKVAQMSGASSILCKVTGVLLDVFYLSL